MWQEFSVTGNMSKSVAGNMAGNVAKSMTGLYQEHGRERGKECGRDITIAWQRAW